MPVCQGPVKVIACIEECQVIDKTIHDPPLKSKGYRSIFFQNNHFLFGHIIHSPWNPAHTVSRLL
jgi:hypothetical protein